ncbi:MAG: rhodanese-like domain-containing protein [Bacteroidota bacterium]
MKNLSKILLFLVFASSFTSCKEEVKQDYVLSPEEILNFYVNGGKTNSKFALSEEEFADIVLLKDTVNYEFIDIRSAHKFIESHLPHATNIPLSKKFLCNENMLQLNQDKKILILFGEDSSQAVATFLLLKQLGFKNLKVALGGCKYAKGFLMRDFGMRTGVYNDEKARYNYAKVVAETAGAGSVAPSSSAPKPKKKAVKREKKAVSGGCG